MLRHPAASDRDRDAGALELLADRARMKPQLCSDLA